MDIERLTQILKGLPVSAESEGGGLDAVDRAARQLGND